VTGFWRSKNKIESTF